MSLQEIFNIVLVLCGFLCSWVFKNLWSTLKELQVELSKVKDSQHVVEVKLPSDYALKSEVNLQFDRLAEKMGRFEAVEVMLASQYMTKQEFIGSMDQIFTKLDKFDEKLDNLSNKQNGK